MKRKIIFYIISIIISTSLFGQKVSKIDTTDAQIVIKLVTIGPGHDLTSWWGHTAIIVEDKSKLESKFYNYGLFSFEEENFILNFIMGRLIFWVGAWRTPNALAYYKGLDRDIRFQTLNLSKEESLELKAFLENNVKPENARYLYDHYYDNCSTRIRDIFERISNGRLREIGREKSRKTLREHTRRHTYHNPLMDFILMFLMSDTIDKKITVWDDMFLPSEMETVLNRLTYMSDEGDFKNFIKQNLIYYESQTVKPVPETAPLHWPFTLILGIILGIIPIWFVYMESDGLFFVYCIFIGLVFGFMGSLLFFFASFTNHTVTYYNENLFLANPFTFIFFITAILSLKNKNRFFNIFYYTTILLGVIATLGLFLKLIPAFDQDNIQSITLIYPLIIGTCISAIQIKKRVYS